MRPSRHLGFAEIIRSIFQWDKLGAITNGSSMLRLFPTFNNCSTSKMRRGEVTLYLSHPGAVPDRGRVHCADCGADSPVTAGPSPAIRDDEVAAETAGINLARHKQFLSV